MSLRYCSMRSQLYCALLPRLVQQGCDDEQIIFDLQQHIQRVISHLPPKKQNTSILYITQSNLSIGIVTNSKRNINIFFYVFNNTVIPTGVLYGYIYPKRVFQLAKFITFKPFLYA